ncbi:hypothetical protein KAFR_0E02480 [Kazachstania africana CBS 2517]|uniref:Pre-mRNA-splicing factor n=1 Tax=Kazachstania africana (strain ATCC 22294 / BCRC 22015 / CBS 2517 / CECT 1963 / NBRC 1671 / NRRL Y-8276) TaxID=1071382 RepID=H2AVK1_KAZAF|nr:hypothetical protein KAFR_0E02480 [Kazachstania africana CBS 2517]CCF58401.1 hypothetical protein KAFR_0E02480 [Kazachstania africana CBS 2517]
MSFSLNIKSKGKNKKKRSKPAGSTVDIFNEGVDGLQDEELASSKKRKIRITEISKFTEENENAKKDAELVISMDNTDEPTKMVTSVEEYETVPVELFGEAMLRGMGWDGKYEKEEEKAKSINEKKQIHPEGLGIGAKGSNASLAADIESFMPVVKVKKQNSDDK